MDHLRQKICAPHIGLWIYVNFFQLLFNIRLQPILMVLTLFMYQYLKQKSKAMDEATFSQVLQKAGNHFLPWDKVRDVREAFNSTSYYFTTSQIRQLLILTTSESDRLELAKLSWSRVTDPSYFTQLLDMFTNQSSRNDLSAYIQAYPF